MIMFSKGDWKYLRSEGYNWNFNKKDGTFMRWGKTEKDDPDMSPFGPEIVDMEISEVCSKGCSFCYKSNTKCGNNMSLETFKKILSILPLNASQIAFGIGDIDGNESLWDIFKHCRENDVVPNVTINGARMTPEYFDNLAKYCGAVAVSRYKPVDECYNAIHELHVRGMKQKNIHMLLARETYEDCFKVIDDACSDPRLEGLNAIVFLSLKEKGRGTSMHSLRDPAAYKKLIEYAMSKNVGIGFDSCSAPLFLKAVEGNEKYNEFMQLAEPCESTLFSLYVDVNGKAWPCSFLEELDYEGVDLLQINSKEEFIEKCWGAKGLCSFRKDVLATAESKECLVCGVRECPKYKIYKN
jgi:hypothetical protein